MRWNSGSHAVTGQHTMDCRGVVAHPLAPSWPPSGYELGRSDERFLSVAHTRRETAGRNRRRTPIPFEAKQAWRARSFLCFLKFLAKH